MLEILRYETISQFCGGRMPYIILLMVLAVMTYIISVLADKGSLPKLKSIFKYYAVMEHPVRSSAI